MLKSIFELNVALPACGPVEPLPVPLPAGPPRPNTPGWANSCAPGCPPFSASGGVRANGLFVEWLTDPVFVSGGFTSAVFVGPDVP